MGMTLTDTLPQDAGSQKFMAPVQPSNAQFVLPKAVNVEAADSLDYADQGISQGARQGKATQTHDAVSVDTTESIGTEIVSSGYTRAGIHVDVGTGADIRVRVYGRLASAGANYLLDLIVDGQEANTRQLYVIEIASPYLAIGLEAISGSATCSCTVYLIP